LGRRRLGGHEIAVYCMMSGVFKVACYLLIYDYLAVGSNLFVYRANGTGEADLCVLGSYPALQFMGNLNIIS
jgi:hypothetical protein